MHQVRLLLDKLHDDIEYKAQHVLAAGGPSNVAVKDAMMELEWMSHVYNSLAKSVKYTHTYDIHEYGACPDWHDHGEAPLGHPHYEVHPQQAVNPYGAPHMHPGWTGPHMPPQGRPAGTIKSV